MSYKYLARWKIPDNNFYPISIVCAANNDQQSTTVMVASVEQVVSVSMTTLTREQNEAKVFTRCEQEFDEPVRELKRTESNILLISSDGKLLVYEALDEKFVQIDAYNHVLHAEQGPGKRQLFKVRQTSAGKIVLELIELSDGCSSHLTLKSCDLVIESIDSSARLSIKCLIVNAVNERFLGNFLGFTKLSVGDQVLLIAINNTLYWVQEQANGESDLIALRCFASCVLDFDFFESSLCLTVLLQAGVLVIFAQSLVPEALLVATSSVFLHAPVEAYAFEKANNGFLYSNGLSTHRVQFYYSEETKQIITESSEVPVRGVIGITVLASESVALLLTENNQFYTIDCRESEKQTSVSDVPKMFLLRKDNRAGSKRVTKMLTEEVQFDQRIDRALQVVQAKFDVLALYQNRTAFEALAHMDVTFHREMPPRKGKALLFGHRKECVCLFASVKIAINQGFFALLSKQKQWSICIAQSDSDLHSYPVLGTFSPAGELSAIVCLTAQDLACGLPTFRCMLVTTVQNGNESLLLSIPMPAHIESTNSCAARLIHRTPSSLIVSECCVKNAARDIIAQNNPHPVRQQDEKRTITYCIRNEQSKTKAASFSSVLEDKPDDTWFALDAPVRMRWHGEKATLCAKTDCPVAMDLVKRLLLDTEEYLAEMEERRDKLKGLSLELQAVTDGSLIIQLYRKLRNNDIVEDDVAASI
ncbi:uncharacterized protein LOC120899957 [Anopheles arabiensis]|uniref:Uncharacterized protein n=1 Tax=Anopheles arabiensis TaxID=7173 RepID=A0A182HRH6_ANOAR|nr:uncharacterized protein LOC120899957 [Anopheles arabiensis]